MTLFLQAMYKIRNLMIKADVKSKPRLSITFDNEADSARFIREINRDLDATISVKYDRISQYGEFTVYGIEIRII